MTSSRPPVRSRRQRRSRPLPWLWLLILALALATLALDLMLYQQVRELKRSNRWMQQALTCLDEQLAHPTKVLECSKLTAPKP